MKVAIAIIVKDEAMDILPWICWYFNLRVSTVIFYDDTSTDGTFELARDASGILDVRLHRVPPSTDFYTNRQKQCYFHTIAEYGDEFDWIGFLDADEYLALPDGQDLLSFLNRSKDVGAVAINWCNYGSSGHVLKPVMPAFYAYNKHYDRGEAINRHVKTFVRPKQWVKQWQNVHFFDVQPLRYEDPMGRSIIWSSVVGITQDEAQWEGAKLMHYQCRSMEHFIERVRKRPDIPAHPSLWAAYDHSDIEDNSPRRQYESVVIIMRSVVQAAIARATRVHSGLSRRPNFVPASHPFSMERNSPKDLKSQSATPASVAICRVITHLGTSLTRSPGSMKIGSGIVTDASRKEQAVFAVLVSDFPEVLFLLESVDREQPLLIEEDPRICGLLTYEIVQLGQVGRIALRHPTTRLFLSCEPPESTGKLTASRHLINDWEQFTLEEAGVDGKDLDKDSRVELIRAFASGSRNLRQFLRERRDIKPETLCTIFPALVSLVTKVERETLRALCGAASQYIF